MPTMDVSVIAGFTGEYQFLSNFHESRITMDGCSYPTVEAAYQASKTLDPETRRLIRLETSPGRAKRLGRKAALRPDWEEIKFGVMEQLVRQKFTIHPDLARRLLETGDSVIREENRWGDTLWGTCEGEGENWLGLILMRVRSEIRQLVDETA